MTAITVKDAAAWLLAGDRYLVINHVRPDGDAHGSAAALVCGLRQCGKTAYIYRNPETTAKFMPIVEEYFAPEGFEPEHVVTVDTASLQMLAQGAEGYSQRVDLSIDHHPSNTGYAARLCLDGSMSSCGEIVYRILRELPCGVSQEAATPLYIAVSTDTGCFAFGNTTSNSLRTAAELADAGAPLGPLNRRFFRTKAKGRMLLEGLIYSSVEFYFNDRVAIITITRDMMARFGVTENEMDDIAAIPGSVENVLVGITIRELTGPGDCKVSVRSAPEFDANALCRRFGGGGHAMAAGCSAAVSAAEMKRRLIEALEESFSTK